MLNIAELLKLKEPLILASKSPRRKLLLERLGFQFSIIPSQIKEKELPKDRLPEKYAARLAYEKAGNVAKMLDYKAVVVGADTIVLLDNKILHKPKSPESAYKMLRMLSGRRHTVITGISLIESVTNKAAVNFEKTEVTFRELGDEEINAYISTGSPMDKAGGYGIQDDFGALFVSNINGCYYNVVGLPLACLYVTLMRFCSEQ